MHSGQLSDREFEVFVSGVERFMKAADLSANTTAKVVEVSVPTLTRWINRKNIPYRWMAAEVIKKIKVLNAANKEHGVYKDLKNMRPADQVERLHSILRAA